MFETNEMGKCRSVFSRPGEYRWGYVNLVLQVPFFFATFAVLEEQEEVFSQSILLSDVMQLKDISLREDIRLRYVDLVSPQYVNKSCRWKMEPLSEIWVRIVEGKSHQYQHEFVLESGERYTTMAAPNIEMTSGSSLLFKM